MKIMTAVAAFTLALVPVTASADCRGDVHTQMSTSTCAEGQVWDVQTQACVDSASS